MELLLLHLLILLFLPLSNNPDQTDYVQAETERRTRKMEHRGQQNNMEGEKERKKKLNNEQINGKQLEWEELEVKTTTNNGNKN